MTCGVMGQKDWWEPAKREIYTKIVYDSLEDYSTSIIFKLEELLDESPEKA